MASFGDLQQGSYYVIQEVENATLELVYIPLVTGKCVLLEYQDDDQTLAWFKKSDQLFEIVEELTDEQAVIYEGLFAEDEDEDDPWENEGDDLWDLGDEDEEEDRALKN